METQKLNTLLFDLDGTLLPLDQKRFVTSYFSLFVEKCRTLGYEASATAKGLSAGLTAMMLNDGSMTNKERFELTFSRETGIDSHTFNRRFASFYDEDFCTLAEVAQPSSDALKIIQTVKEKGYTAALATTPVFPWQGSYHRIAWASLKPEQFALISTYEDFHYTKPHPSYYQEMLDKLDRKASQCMMIGNDVKDDMVAQSLGMQVYLVTDCLLNETHAPITDIPKGSLSDLLIFCKELESV